MLWSSWDAVTWATVAVAFFALVQIGQGLAKEWVEARRRRKLSEVRAGIVAETLSRTLLDWAARWPGYNEPAESYWEWYKRIEPEFTATDTLMLRLADEVVNLKDETAAKALETVKLTRASIVLAQYIRGEGRYGSDAEVRAAADLARRRIMEADESLDWRIQLSHYQRWLGAGK